MNPKIHLLAAILLPILLNNCGKNVPGEAPPHTPHATQFLNAPLIETINTANPSARQFGERLYIYPSHDSASPNTASSSSVDYHVFALDDINGPISDLGPALHIGEIPWAKQQLSGPDTVEKNGNFYLYFAAQDDKDIFRIGVAIADKPEGPFTPQETPITGTYSTDPSVFQDDDGAFYLYLGGIGTGQLQRWQGNSYNTTDGYPADNSPTLLPRIAKLGDNMISLQHPLTEVPLLDETGNLINFGDKARRFASAPWVHKNQGVYYLSWFSGESGLLQYATSDNPYGPFHWRGRLMEPVYGTGNHHAIVAYNGKWYVFYHDASQTGQDQLRSVKVTELSHNPDGTITTIDPYLGD